MVRATGPAAAQAATGQPHTGAAERGVAVEEAGEATGDRSGDYCRKRRCEAKMYIFVTVSCESKSKFVTNKQSKLHHEGAVHRKVSTINTHAYL